MTDSNTTKTKESIDIPIDIPTDIGHATPTIEIVKTEVPTAYANEANNYLTPYVHSYKVHKVNKAGEVIEYTYNKLYLPRRKKPQIREYLTQEIQNEIIELSKDINVSMTDIASIILPKINDNAKILKYPLLTMTQIKSFLYRQR